MFVYLDHNATTPPDPAAVDEMVAYYRDEWGNASSLHVKGLPARRAVESAREEVALLIGADPAEITFVSGATEANNTVLKGVLAAGKRKHVVVSSIEHPCVLETAKYLEKHGKADLTVVGVDREGLVSPDELRAAIRDDTALVSVMMVNNEIGTVQDIKPLAAAAHERGAFFHTDAVQAVGKIPVDVAELGIDFLSLSAHKFYGPKGVGALYSNAKHKRAMRPLIHGGHQEKSRRAGTENVPGIVGLGAASRIARERMTQDSQRIGELTTRLKESLLSRVEMSSVNGPEDVHRIFSTVNMSFAGVEGEGMVLSLSDLGICLSTGSACSSGSLEPSHVLLAIGVAAEEAHGSLRFSLGRSTTEEQIDYTIGEVASVVERLRSMSPMWQEIQRATAQAR